MFEICQNLPTRSEQEIRQHIREYFVQKTHNNLFSNDFTFGLFPPFFFGRNFAEMFKHEKEFDRNEPEDLLPAFLEPVISQHLRVGLPPISMLNSESMSVEPQSNAEDKMGPIEAIKAKEMRKKRKVSEESSNSKKKKKSVGSKDAPEKAAKSIFQDWKSLVPGNLTPCVKMIESNSELLNKMKDVEASDFEEVKVCMKKFYENFQKITKLIKDKGYDKTIPPLPLHPNTFFLDKFS